MSYGKSIDFLFNQMRNGSIGSLAGGWIYFYSAGTTSSKSIWFDREMTLEAANPYQLSADGTAELFGNGLYRIVVKSPALVTIFDYDNVLFEDIDIPPAEDPSILLVDASFSPQVLVVPNQADLTIIRVDDSVNAVEIIPPIGYTFNDGLSVFLYNQRESITFRKSGTVYYILRGGDIISFAPITYLPTATSTAYQIVSDASAGDQNVSWPDGTTEIYAIRIDATANTVTLTPPAGYTIALATTYTLSTQGESVHLLLNGTNYYVV